ncbi:MAG: Asp-tRNA(Asn)/Glu-tRNA(Gln) amidotransferase GatCAB subunit B, partial [Saprospiraceae bacterium]
MENSNKYEAVIGLEVHVQLNTKTKAFCADSAAFGGQPNAHTSPISLAHPG